MWTRWLSLVMVMADVTVAAEMVPPGSVSIAAQEPRIIASNLDQVRNLIEADRHLSAAGEIDAAREMRRKAEALLAAERARLDAEQREFTALDRQMEKNNGPEIEVQTTLLGVDALSAEQLDRLCNDLGGEWIAAGAGFFPHAVKGAILVEADKTCGDVRRQLEQFKSAPRLVFAPSITVRPGQQGTVASETPRTVVSGVTTDTAGHASPVYKTETAGVRLRITSDIESDGRVRLMVSSESRRFSDKSVPIFVDTAGTVFKSPIQELDTSMVSVTAPQDRLLILPRLAPLNAGNTIDRSANSTSERELWVILEAQVAPERERP